MHSWVKLSILPILAALFVFISGGAATAAGLSGSFEGRSNHVVNGGVKIGDDGTIVLDDAFFLDGAPDPKVAVSMKGQSRPKNMLAPLQNKTGTQSYSLPEGSDVSSITHVWIWCEQFDVPLGVAQVK